MLDFSKTWVCFLRLPVDASGLLQIRQHLEVAAKLGRPFLLGEFGKQKPVVHRNAFYEMVHTELKQAAKRGYPVAGSFVLFCLFLKSFLGSLMWMLSDEEYPDYDGFTVYDELRATKRRRPPAPLISTESVVSNLVR